MQRQLSIFPLILLFWLVFPRFGDFFNAMRNLSLSPLSNGKCSFPIRTVCLCSVIIGRIKASICQNIKNVTPKIRTIAIFKKCLLFKQEPGRCEDVDPCARMTQWSNVQCPEPAPDRIERPGLCCLLGQDASREIKYWKIIM